MGGRLHHPQPGDVGWTPADWAWIGGLIDVLFPSWHHGIPVLAHRVMVRVSSEAREVQAQAIRDVLARLKVP